MLAHIAQNKDQTQGCDLKVFAHQSCLAAWLCSSSSFTSRQGANAVHSILARFLGGDVELPRSVGELTESISEASTSPSEDESWSSQVGVSQRLCGYSIVLHKYLYLYANVWSSNVE